MPPSDGLLSLDELRALVDNGQIDTVLVAATDMQGRLQGKRCAAPYFLDVVAPHAAEACSYLLAVDVDMNTVDGYEMSSWDSGYGDFVLKPDFTTLRLVPWLEGTALVLCDLQWEDGTDVVASPRQILRKQLERLAHTGLEAYVGTELEFIVFKDSYETAWQKAYRGLEPANQYNVDYSMIGTGRIEHLLRRIRNGMTGAGMYVESAKGECNLGQHEIGFRYDDALTTCDNHSIYKTGAKEIAAQEGMSLTFMAKFDEREGNSCHIHMSLRSTGGDPVLAGEQPYGFSPLMEHFLAGQLACLRDFSLFFAPNVNSYKRYAPGSFAPTAAAWGPDNRTCALRVVGHDLALRVENRVPGGDVNPYLAVAAMIASGLHGIERELALEPPVMGNAYASDQPHMPTTLGEAAQCLEESKVAVAAFGEDVIAHYLNGARIELAAYDSVVTDWERFRGFERL
ncbi:glutamine synthetase family protein [Phytoactinopolyspora mesophila]|uniref:Glutamine synthetase n=1 Tax=Phytoactinopolyspora mesophila TaxID=2650750 RepID=A0A7K3M5B6_9ACTN|nr:glutamine synthetase family protein [Phytoactinopolyspora mesophila]NDL58503.1 glutamine synthetase [Phytoactinopolyspora mesophila]